MGKESVVQTRVNSHSFHLTPISKFGFNDARTPDLLLGLHEKQSLNEGVGILPYDGNYFLGIHKPLEGSTLFKGKNSNQDEGFLKKGAMKSSKIAHHS